MWWLQSVSKVDIVAAPSGCWEDKCINSLPEGKGSCWWCSCFWVVSDIASSAKHVVWLTLLFVSVTAGFILGGGFYMSKLKTRKEKRHICCCFFSNVWK